MLSVFGICNVARKSGGAWVSDIMHAKVLGSGDQEKRGAAA